MTSSSRFCNVLFLLRFCYNFSKDDVIQTAKSLNFLHIIHSNKLSSLDYICQAHLKQCNIISLTFSAFSVSNSFSVDQFGVWTKFVVDDKSIESVKVNIIILFANISVFFSSLFSASSVLMKSVNLFFFDEIIPQRNRRNRREVHSTFLSFAGNLIFCFLNLFQN